MAIPDAAEEEEDAAEVAGAVGVEVGGVNNGAGILDKKEIIEVF